MEGSRVKWGDALTTTEPKRFVPAAWLELASTRNTFECKAGHPEEDYVALAQGTGLQPRCGTGLLTVTWTLPAT